MKQSIEKLDRNFAPARVEGNQHWYDIRDLGVEGRPFEDTQNYYDRLPARAQGRVRDIVWQLSQHSAGMSVRFVTDATHIAARWKLRFDSLAMHHMPAIGVSGLDLFLKQDGQWHWVGVAWPLKFPDNEMPLTKDEGGLSPGRREYQLYLPLYNGVEQVEIGLPPDAQITAAPAHPHERRKPICFYGTSIVQGGCASRPGMCYTAVLSRRLDWPHVNLGFSGNGKLEPEVAELLAELDPSVYVIDSVPNNDPDGVRHRLGPFVRRLRQAHPHTPIVLVGSIIFRQAPFVPFRQNLCRELNVAFREVVGQLEREGVTRLDVVPGEELLGTDDQATVDGAHPTDLGFQRIADGLEPALRRALHITHKKVTQTLTLERTAS